MRVPLVVLVTVVLVTASIAQHATVPGPACAVRLAHALRVLPLTFPRMSCYTLPTRVPTCLIRVFPYEPRRTPTAGVVDVPTACRPRTNATGTTARWR